MRRCREMSKLVSESMDRHLTAVDRFQVWFHLLMCGFCRGFNYQLRLLRHALREHSERLEPPGNPPEFQLSPEAAQRIKTTLRYYCEHGDG